MHNKKNTGLQCYMSADERVAEAERGERQAEERLTAKRFQLMALESALRILRDYMLNDRSVPIAYARFADESLKTLDCTPEQCNRLRSELLESK